MNARNAPPRRTMKNMMTIRMKSQYPKDISLMNNPNRLSQNDSSFVNISGSIKESKIITPRKDTKRNQGTNHPPSFSSSISLNSFPQCGQA